MTKDEVKVVKELLTRYIGLANSGDCGWWDPDKDPQVIKVRELLKKYESG